MWKYRYPPNSSSAPSPDRTILNPMLLIRRLSRYMGTDARTCSNVSRWYTTSGSASKASSGVKWISWCTVPSWSATFFAAARSGAPLMPMLNECTGSDAPNVLVASALCLTAMEVMRLESSPPDSKTAYGTSAMRRFFTASTTVSLSSVRSA